MKCKLKNTREFERKLADIDLKFSHSYWLHDRVYVPRNYRKNSSYPRLTLRTEVRAVSRPARYELILRRHIEDSGVDIIDSTAVDNYQEAAAIVIQLGFKLQSEVSARRQEIIMNEGTTLYLDRIEGVEGAFAKIEANLSDTDKVSDVLKDLTRTFRVLGQTRIIRESYGDLMP